MPQRSFSDVERSVQSTFFRMPVGAAPFAGSDAVLLGIPYDGGATFHPGARFGPNHVRSCSRNTSSPILEQDTVVLDGGNVTFPMFDRSAVRSAIEESVGAVLAAGAVPLSVGGDHSVTYPCLRAVARERGPLALIQFDAHADTGTAGETGDAHHHGAPIRLAAEEGLLVPGAIIQVGLRVADDEDFAARYGIHRYPADDLDLRGVAEIAAEMRRLIGDRPTYVTFDIDGIDPAFAPGTGIQEPGGISSREALRFLRLLRGIHLAGMDLVEVLPARDHADITGLLAAALLCEGIGLVQASPSMRRAPAGT